MKKYFRSKGLGLACGAACLLLVTASIAESATITSVVVTIGSRTYNAGTVGWSFPVTLLGGQDLVLTQDFQGTPNSTTAYNFDTSDDPDTRDPLFPSIAVTADGFTTVFTDLNQVLNVRSQGAVDLSSNEAQDYGAALIGPGYQIFLGYADNVHPGECGAYATSLGLLGSSTCLPSIFAGATYFFGRGALNPGLLQPNDGFHCAQAQVANCYDAGVIRIVATSSAVPEPATTTLVLTGLVGVFVQRVRHRRHGRSLVS